MKIWPLKFKPSGSLGRCIIIICVEALFIVCGSIVWLWDIYLILVLWWGSLSHLNLAIILLKRESRLVLMLW